MTTSAAPDRLTYPPAERLDLVESLHGRPVADPYRWLEDPADPRCVAWSAAQDRLFEDQATDWPAREHFATRIRDLSAAGGVGVPVWRGDRFFTTRRQGDQEHGVLLTGPTPERGRDLQELIDAGLTRVLVDPIALDPSGLTTLDAWTPDPSGRWLAYQLSHGGTEESVLRVMDVATGAEVEGPIDRVRYSPVAWLPDGDSFFYVRRLDPARLPEGEEQYHRRVYLHRVGADPATDVEVLGAGRDPRTYYGVSVSRDGRWLSVSAAVGTEPRNDAWLADLGLPGDADRAQRLAAPPLREVAVGLDARVGVHVERDGRVYVFTDLDAPRGRLAVTTTADPGPDTWTDLLPQHPDAVLEDYAVLDGAGLGDHPVLLAAWTRHAVSHLSGHDLRTGTPLTGPLAQPAPPGVGTLSGLAERPEGGHEVWFGYTDHTRPAQVFRLDARTGEVGSWARPPGSVAVPEVVTRQLTYPSPDGTPVRMFVVARADAVTGPDGAPLGPRPTVLYGYGGFGVPLVPAYSASILAWVEAGGVYAVANLRGGSEEGEEWHRAGMLGAKQNVFDDFHAAAEYLIGQGWTTPDRLACHGGSNGGLLVGAALTQRPELFAAVVCSAPLLDMVRYEQFGLGATWNVEYGSAQSPEQLDWLLGYSPYHRVTEGVAYPAVLFTVFDGDTRVDPLHARKLCAALQAATVGRGPVLLRAERDVGHGSRALSRSIALSADSLGFTARWTGLHPAPREKGDPTPCS